MKEYEVKLSYMKLKMKLQEDKWSYRQNYMRRMYSKKLQEKLDRFDFALWIL